MRERVKLQSYDVVFFFGAGASAPFGIPTMERFVVEFEKFLNENADKNEREMYSDIKQILEAKIHRNVDLEAVFTVIDGIINYDNPEKLGMLALYFEAEQRKDFPNTEHVKVCRKLKLKFQNFIKDKCRIPETYTEIRNVYKDFFNRIAKDLGEYEQNGMGFAYNRSWTIFTTNYDTSLEYYWCQYAGINLDTNFDYDRIKKRNVLKPERILNENLGLVKLCKLHGSVNWLIDKDTGEIVELTEKGSSFIGRTYSEELMLYPIAEKELYLEPFISMLLRLNRELKKKQVWVVVGYNFNDPIILEIFRRNWIPSKKLIIVHPRATEILTGKLMGIKGDPVEKYFGLKETELDDQKKEEYRKVNHQIMHKLVKEPLAWNQPV